MRHTLLLTAFSVLTGTVALAADEFSYYGSSGGTEVTVHLASAGSDTGTVQSADAYCDTCDSCDACGCLATPWHPCGDMHPHYPYDAWPKTYYYFRPYSYRHVRLQQEQASLWNAPAGLPYSNAIFQSVYAQFETP